jgi:site-specific DNA-methyltransferase (adenine-specific)
MLEINKVYQGDCLEVMKLISDKSIDLIVTDPPYGIDYLSSRTDNHIRLENDSFEDWNKLLPLWLAGMKRV